MTSKTQPITEQTSSQNINRIIGNVKRSMSAYNQHVQDAIVAIITHSHKYNDCTGAARLLDAMPRSNRRQLAVDHFGQYSPINVTRGKDGKFKASLRKPYFDKAETKPNDLYRDYNIKGVTENNWWERKNADKLPDVVDYSSIRASMLKFFDSQLKKAEKCENDDEKQEAERFIKTLRSTASNFNAKIADKYAFLDDDDDADDIRRANQARKAA